MLPSKMKGDQYALYFSVERSIRYHARRCGFFETLHRITSYLTVLMAGSFIFQITNTLQHNGIINVVSWCAAIFAGADVVLGFSRKADLHRDLKRRFIDLEQAILVGDGLQGTWNVHYANRVGIEKDEPSKYSGLDVLCHNETLIALGHDEDLRNVCWIVGLTAHFLKWSNIGASLKPLPKEEVGESSPAS